MGKHKILYVCSKMKPYLGDNEEAELCHNLPQAMQERGCEARAFIPRFGAINERRSQLHEVIRLSGKNILVDKTEYQLIIKVASLPVSRMQIYFIDNEDFFHRKGDINDCEGVSFSDNDERAIFFAKGVIETSTKLRWSPDIVHCFDWFTAILPVLAKRQFNELSLYENSKIVLSLHDNFFEGELDVNMAKKIVGDNITEEETAILSSPTYENVIKFALQYVDGVVFEGKLIPETLKEFIRNSGVEVLEVADKENYVNEYSEFYEKVLG